MGFIDDEVLAQSLLAARGIEPRAGWIANYPVTPLVMGELREALISSSESGRVDVTRAEALAAFDGLALELGLAVDHLAGQGYAEAPPPGGGLPPESLPYGEPPVTGYYDYHAEPPILAYYPPPPVLLWILRLGAVPLLLHGSLLLGLLHPARLPQGPQAPALWAQAPWIQIPWEQLQVWPQAHQQSALRPQAGQNGACPTRHGPPAGQIRRSRRPRNA